MPLFVALQVSASPSVLSWELLKQRASVRRSAGFVFRYLAALETSSNQLLLGALDLYLNVLNLYPMQQRVSQKIKSPHGVCSVGVMVLYRITVMRVRLLVGSCAFF